MTAFVVVMTSPNGSSPILHRIHGDADGNQRDCTITPSGLNGCFVTTLSDTCDCFHVSIANCYKCTCCTLPIVGTGAYVFRCSLRDAIVRKGALAKSAHAFILFPSACGFSVAADYTTCTL